MSTDIHSEPPMNQLSEAAREAARRAGDAANKAVEDASATAKDVTDDAKDAARHATDKAREMCRSAALKAEETLETSKEFVRRNPVPVVLGAIAFGAAIGYLLVMARRKPTFSERYVDEPLVAVRDAIRGAVAPVTKRVHKGYDWARDGAGKAMDRLPGFGAGRNGDSLSHKIGHIGSNLKFW